MKLTLSAFVFPLAIKSTFIPPITTCNRIVIACTVMYDCLIFTNLEFEKNMCLYSQYWNLNWMEILTLLEKFDVLILCHSSALTEHRLFDCQLLRCYEWEQCLETEHVKDTLVLIHCRPKVSNSNIVMPVNHLRTLSFFTKVNHVYCIIFWWARLLKGYWPEGTSLESGHWLFEEWMASHLFPSHLQPLRFQSENRKWC